MNQLIWLMYCCTYAKGSDDAPVQQPQQLGNLSPALFDHPLMGTPARFLYTTQAAIALMFPGSAVSGPPVAAVDRVSGPEVNVVSKLNTPLGEIVVPFSSLLSRGLKMLIEVVEQQQIPISQSDLETLTSGLSDLAIVKSLSPLDELDHAAPGADPVPQKRGISFVAPDLFDKALAEVAAPMALVGMHENRPRLVDAEHLMDLVPRLAGQSETAEAIATLGLAAAIAEMDEQDFPQNLQNLDPSMSDRELTGSSATVRDYLVKELLASTTDTLPWLPLDKIVGTLPGFLVDRMGKTGEWLGTLASYWKSGAETIDNVAGGLLKPILNNFGDQEDEDYTGRNGFVENLNVPDEDMSIKKKIVTGAGIPPRPTYEEPQAYPSFPANLRERIDYRGGSRLRRLSALTGWFNERDYAEDYWHYPEIDLSWRPMERFDNLLKTNAALTPGSEISKIRHRRSPADGGIEFGDAPPLFARSEDLDWDLRKHAKTPEVEGQGDGVVYENLSERMREDIRQQILDQIRGDGGGISDDGSQRAGAERTHIPLLKKISLKDRTDTSDSANPLDDGAAPGPLQVIKNFVKTQHAQSRIGQRSKSDALRSPTASDSPKAEKEGLEKLIVGDDFDDEDELFDDEEEAVPNSRGRPSSGPRSHVLKRKSEGSAVSERPMATLRELREDGLSELEPGLGEYVQAADGKNFQQSPNILDRLISSFVGGAERYRPVAVPTLAAAPVAMMPDSNAIYSNYKAAVERQKEQLDEYLEQMASIYQVPGPAVEAKTAQEQEEEARLAEQRTMIDELMRKVSEQMDASLREAEVQWKKDQARLWEELKSKEAGTIAVVADQEGEATDLKPAQPEEGAVAETMAEVEPPVPPVAEVNSEPEFFPVVASGAKLVTVKDLIEQMVSSFQKLSGTGPLMASAQGSQSPRRRLQELAPLEADVEVVYETESADFAVVRPADDQTARLFSQLDWSDLKSEWANVRSNLVSQIASSVGDVSKTVNHNPLSEIVQSLIDGIVDSNPLINSQASLSSSNDSPRYSRGDNDAPYGNERYGGPRDGGGAAEVVRYSRDDLVDGDDEDAEEPDMQERIAHSAASMLRQISNKVLKSGPRIKSSAADLELRQPDPDPVKKAPPPRWWF